MFENIIFQESVVAELKRDITAEKLPGSLLFYGPELSGKGTAAIELARVLTCEAEGIWRCTCPACLQQKELLHQNTVSLGMRPFAEEIRICGKLVLREDSIPHRYMWIRSVRKLLRRFDSILWEGEERKIKGVADSLLKCEDLLELFDPAQGTTDEKERIKNVDTVTALSGKLIAALPAQPSINHIRCLQRWAHRTASGKKIAIIENADAMQESARNSLLKLLEEPPADLYMIMTTTRRNAMIKTILSRLRPYAFRNRSIDEQSSIIEKLFRAEKPVTLTLADFFSGEEEIQKIRARADAFVDAAISGKPFDNEGIGKVDGADFPRFIKAVTERIAEERKRESAYFTMERCMKWNDASRIAISGREIFHQSPDLLTESLFYAINEGVS